MALWSSASAAESLPSSAWLDSKKDDSWLRAAAGERYELPVMTDKQFRDMSELLGMGKDTLEKSLPSRLKLEPELLPEVERIMGKAAPAAEKPLPSLAPEPLPAPAPAPEKPELHEPLSPAPKREHEIKRDNVKVPDDEFTDSIADKPGLPGDPRLK